MSVSAIDLVVLGLYLTIVLVIGVLAGRGQRKLDDYLLGGRNLPWWAVLGSIVATETSTATFLSVPGLAYAQRGDLGAGDIRFLQLTIGYLIGRLLISIVLMPHFFRGKIFSAYELLDKRFGPLTKKIASLIFLVARNLGDGLRLFLAALALEAMLGLPLSLCVVIVGLLTIIYTYFGGMKSVVWNDCLQFVVYMVGGVVAIGVIVANLPEGWTTFMEFGRAEGKFRLIDPQIDFTENYTLLSGLIGGMFLTLGTHGTDQMNVQRYLCARSSRDAGRALVGSGLVVMLQFALFLMIGVGLACFYSGLEGKPPEKGDQAFARFIVDYLPMGLAGLIMAAVFAAAMSTLSSSLNSSATAVVNDLLPTKQWSEKRAVHASRLLTIAFGVVQIAIGIGAQYLSDNVVTNVLAIAGFTAGLLLGLFVLALWCPQVRQPAAIGGMLGGLVTLTLVRFLTPIAGLWYAAIGSLTTIVIALGLSLLSSQGPPTRKPGAN